MKSLMVFELEGGKLGDEIQGDNLTEWRRDPLRCVQGFEAGVGDCHLVIAIPEEIAGDGCAADFLAVEVDQRGGWIAGDGEGAFDAAGGCQHRDDEERGAKYAANMRRHGSGESV